MSRPVRRAPEGADKDERYTTPDTDALCRQLAGVRRWDLDVAACRESHLAARYFTKADDGLAKTWSGRAVWCNPPWSTLGPWVRKAWREMARAGGPDVVAMLVPGGRTEQPWFQERVEPFRDGRGNGPVMLTTHNLPGRQRFGHPGNATAADVGSPPFTATLLVWRRAR